MPSHPQGLLRTCLQHPRRTQRGMKRTPSSLLLGKSIKINVKYKLFRMCLSVSYSRFAQYFRFFFFLSEKKRPKKVPGSGKSFHGPENNQNQRMSSVEILTKKDFRRHATERNYCELSCRQVWQWTREKTCYVFFSTLKN